MNVTDGNVLLDNPVRFSQHSNIETLTSAELVKKKSQHLSPAEYVIHVFRGVRATARAIGRSPSSISKWTSPRDTQGRGGSVPGSVQKTILAKAKELDLDITADDLIFGRDVRVD